MSSIVAFDSKDFSIPGTERDFFCPIGIGIKIADRDGFCKAYRDVVTRTTAKWKIRQKRSVFNSYSVTKLLGGIDSGRDFYSDVLSELKSQINHVYVFHTTIYPRKVPRIFVYETETKSQDPVDFLKEHKAGYVVLCGWKYSEIVHQDEKADMIYLDYFQAKRTRAWDSLRPLHPRLFTRGDTCNPCIAMADGTLALVDRQLRRNYYNDKEKVSDLSISHALRDLGLKGEPVFIGQPDMKKIVPYSRDQILSSEFVSRPIFFLYPEKRPEGMENQQYREMLEYMPVMDKLVERACDVDGCVKFYDVNEDYLLAREGDYLAFFGSRGREMYDALRNHVNVAPLDLSVE